MRLDSYKNLLSRTGRAGKWAGFLREIRIPLATGDRLVQASRRTSIQDGKLLSEELSPPTEVDIARIVAGLTPKLSRQLTSPELVDRFLHILGDALLGAVSVTGDRANGSSTVPGITAAQ